MINKLIYKNKQHGINLYRYLAEEFCKDPETLSNYIVNSKEPIRKRNKLAAFTHEEYIVEYYLNEDNDHIHEIISNKDGMIVNEMLINIREEYPAYFEDLSKVKYLIDLSNYTVEDNIIKYLPAYKMDYIFGNHRIYINNDATNISFYNPVISSVTDKISYSQCVTNLRMPNNKTKSYSCIYTELSKIAFIKLFDHMFDDDVANSKYFQYSLIMHSNIHESKQISGFLNTTEIFRNGKTIFSYQCQITEELDLKERRIYHIDSRYDSREFVIDVGILPPDKKNPKTHTSVRIKFYGNINKIFEAEYQYNKTISEIMSNFNEVVESLIAIYYEIYKRYPSI